MEPCVCMERLIKEVNLSFLLFKYLIINKSNISPKPGLQSRALCGTVCALSITSVYITK